jgi:hypothetical protein
MDLSEDENGEGLPALKMKKRKGASMIWKKELLCLG